MPNVIDAVYRFRPLRCVRCKLAIGRGDDYVLINVPPSLEVADGKAPVHVACMRGGGGA